MANHALSIRIPRERLRDLDRDRDLRVDMVQELVRMHRLYSGTFNSFRAEAAIVLDSLCMDTHQASQVIDCIQRLDNLRFSLRVTIEYDMMRNVLDVQLLFTDRYERQFPLPPRFLGVDVGVTAEDDRTTIIDFLAWGNGYRGESYLTPATRAAAWDTPPHENGRIMSEAESLAAIAELRASPSLTAPQVVAAPKEPQLPKKRRLILKSISN